MRNPKPKRPFLLTPPLPNPVPGPGKDYGKRRRTTAEIAQQLRREAADALAQRPTPAPYAPRPAAPVLSNAEPGASATAHPRSNAVVGGALESMIGTTRDVYHALNPGSALTENMRVPVRSAITGRTVRTVPGPSDAVDAMLGRAAGRARTQFPSPGAEGTRIASMLATGLITPGGEEEPFTQIKGARGTLLPERRIGPLLERRAAEASDVPTFMRRGPERRVPTPESSQPDLSSVAPPTGSLSLDIEHRTPSVLSEGIVHPNYQGTGPVKGAERTRRSAFPDLYVPRAYFTVRGTPVESGFEGLPVHTGQATGLYDIETDPLKLHDAAMAEARQRGTFGPAVASIQERLIRDAGYSGYKRGNVVASFRPVKVSPQIGNARVRTAIDQYMQGRTPGLQLPPVDRVDPVNGARLSQVYEGLKNAPNDPAVRAAYKFFIDETHQQAEALRAAGIHPEYVTEDPYKSSADMMRDLQTRGRIKVFRTAPGQAHPLMTPEQNDEFRFVHDVVGHAMGGNNFTAKGEENAFRLHGATYSAAALPAMATETRGQNSFFNFSKRNQGLPNNQRAFAEQKAALFPSEFLGGYHTFPETITSPAILNGEDVFTGTHHGEAWDRAVNQRVDPIENPQLATGETEGFLTSRNRYVSRAEAARIAGLSKRSGDELLAGGDIMNRESGAPNPNVLPSFVGAGVGATAGAKTGRTPEERRRNALLGGLAGLVLPGVAGVRGETGAFGSLEEMSRYLTPAERAHVFGAQSKILRQQLSAAAPTLGPDEPLIAASLQGQGAVGGYASVHPALRAVFGDEDAPRVAALYAALSPRQKNETALGQAFDIFKRWRDAGRPTNPRRVQRLIGSTLPARIPNAVLALTAENPGSLQLGGNKVGSFLPALMGDPNAVVLDVHNAAGQGIDPNVLDRMTPYLTGSAQVRRVASKIGMTPAQSQESMWSTIRAMRGMGRAPINPNVTPEMAAAQWPRFDTMLNREPFATQLRGMGHEPPPIATPSSGPSFGTPDPSGLESLLNTLQAHRRGQYLLGAGLTSGH